MLIKKILFVLIVMLAVRSSLACMQQTGYTISQQQQLEIANRLTNEAAELGRVGKLGEASAKAKKATDIFLDVLGPRHPTTVFHQHIAGVLLSQQGKQKEAIPYLETAYSAGAKINGGSHEQTVKTLTYLAAAYMETGDLAKAESKTNDYLRLMTEKHGPFHIETDRARNGLYRLYIAQQKPEKARALARQAVDARLQEFGEDNRDTVVAINTYANICLETGETDESLKQYTRSLNILKKISAENDFARREPRMWLSNLANRRSDYKAAQFHMQRAYELTARHKGESHEETCYMLYRLALAIDTAGDEDRAIEMMKRAIALQRKNVSKMHPQIAEMLSDLGEILMFRGALGEARENISEALEIRKQRFGTEHVATAKSLYQWGALLSRQGSLEESLAYMNQALEIQKRLLGEDHHDVGVTTIAIGGLFQKAGKIEAASPYFERTLAIHEKLHGEMHWQTGETVKNYGNHLANRGLYDEALPFLERSLHIRETLLGPDHPDTAATVQSLGSLYRNLGKHDQAKKYYERALDIQLNSSESDKVAELLVHLGTYDLEVGNVDSALNRFDQARKRTTKHINQTLPSMSEREQLRYLAYRFESEYTAMLSLALSRHSNQHVIDQTCDWLLNGKALKHSVLARLKRAEDAVQADQNLKQRMERLSEVRRELANLSLGKVNRDQQKERREEINRLRLQAEELMREVNAALAKTNVATHRWVELQEVRQAIPRKCVLIEIAKFRPLKYGDESGQGYLRRPARYIAWIIPPTGKGETKVVDLGLASKIDNIIQNLNQGIAAASKGGNVIHSEGEAAALKTLDDDMSNVANAIWKPLFQKLPSDTKDLIISPDGSLWLLPWAAVSVTEDSDRVLIEDYSLQYEITGRGIVNVNQAQESKAKKSYVFADPDYDLSPTAAKSALKRMYPDMSFDSSRNGETSQTALTRVNRLPGTRAEVTAISPSIEKMSGKPMSYIGQWAMETFLKKVSNPKLLVLSTHGFFLPDQAVSLNNNLEDRVDSRVALVSDSGILIENPLLRCGLLFAGVNSKSIVAGDDGVLTGLEVSGMNLKDTELVVLSACETGIGQVNNGEGVAGLRQAFQMAGAKSVVSTLWSIPDRESALLMKEFFRNLADGQARSTALRNAQLSRIKSRRDRYGAAHPLFWAAWTITGGSEELISRESASLLTLREKAQNGDAAAQYRLGKIFLDGDGVEKDYQQSIKWFQLSAEQGDRDGINALGFSYDHGYGIERDIDKAISLYRNAAKANSPKALRNLALHYRDGDGVEKDLKEAINLFSQAADLGYVVAQYELGDMYEDGKGVEKNLAEAFKWYQKAAEQGDKRAQAQLGYFYVKGHGVEKDVKTGFKWFKKSADQGHARAIANIGIMYANGIGIGKDQFEAAKWHLKAAELGNVDGQYNLGVHYERGFEEGYGVEKNYAKAFKWYKKAAEQNDPRAQNNLAILYANGRGIGKDLEKSVHWYSKSASLGDEFGQRNLAIAFLEGTGVEKDEAQAVKWFLKAAEQNDSRAQNWLGVLYRDGRGVDKDVSKSIDWFRKAAENGRGSAAKNLANAYLNGIGVEKDENQAFEWFSKAASQGEEEAQFQLGVLYRDGIGTNTDLDLAKKWLTRAKENGHPEAGKAVEDISRDWLNSKLSLADGGNVDAQYALGEAYCGGSFLERDLEKAFIWFKKAAEGNLPEAQYELGYMYHFGNGTKINYTEAMKWYRKAADQGMAKAQNSVGVMYEYGRSVPKNETEALKWYRLAASQNHPLAIHNVGEAYYFGSGIEKDYKQAAIWYRKGAELGAVDCINDLAYLYEKGRGVEQDYSEAMIWYRKSAAKGDASAQKDIGDLYYYGDGVPRDYEQALSWYEKAAANSDASAQGMIGDIFRLGSGVAQNYSTAADWYQKAADAGSNSAKCELGLMYINGNGVEQDRLKGFKLFESAAKDDYAHGQYFMGEAYYNGWGVSRDLKQAVVWYQKAADQGKSYAQVDLGLAYASGQGIQKDLAKAKLWFENAADQNDARGQHFLGIMYLNGDGVAKDLAKAKQWLQKSARNGFKPASEALKKLN